MGQRVSRGFCGRIFSSVLLEPDEEANPISAVVEIKPNTKYDVTYRVDPAQTTHGQVADTAAPNDHRKKARPGPKLTPNTAASQAAS